MSPFPRNRPLIPWLCGIARNVINNWIRRERREPVAEAVPALPESVGRVGEASPTEAAMTREEAELLWKAVEEIPAIFREPLILYYRQDRSVKEVAALLDLTEATLETRNPVANPIPILIRLDALAPCAGLGEEK